MTARVIAVVGAGLAGLRTAEAVRRAGWTERVVVVGDEPHMPYNRPPLSKKILLDGAGSHDQVALRLRPSEHETEWRLGSRVVRSDLDARTLWLADGSSLVYDGLVAASGVTSRRLPESVGGVRRVLRTVDDAVALTTALTAGARVVVIGAGFIGCEVASAAVARGCEVSVVALDAAPMTVPLGPMVGAELGRRHAGAGVRFHLGQGVTSVGEDLVVLTDGTRLRTDLVVEAVGSRPNTDWLAGNDLDLADGVACDARLRMGGTPAAVAVGDVARFPNAHFDDVPRRVEHWQIAADTALHAARTLVADLDAGEQPAAFGTVPAFWSDQGVVSIRSFGMPGLADASAVLEGDLTGEAAIGYTRDGALVGVVLLGLARQTGAYLRRLTAELETAGAGSPV
ncbi:NAD(P)/FAD-dependent oxidoreductase [Streptomyces sp. NPDC059517]|uniref:NAD(P)/FAD-dependent oxidoreductase n=1 Tax=Streptomyces sp. NPDC059517 TaxID=3346855 RepID=UPI0036A3EF08